MAGLHLRTWFNALPPWPHAGEAFDRALARRKSHSMRKSAFRRSSKWNTVRARQADGLSASANKHPPDGAAYMRRGAQEQGSAASQHVELLPAQRSRDSICQGLFGERLG